MEPNNQKLDEADVKLLSILQQDAAISLEELSKRTAMSANTAWRRIKRMEEVGIITKRVALINPEALGIGVTVFVAIKTSDHSDAWLEDFAKAVRAIPEVVEFYRMSGETDYLLKLLVASIGDYDRVYKKLIRSAKLNDVSSSFAMETIKFTTAVPLRI
ncbi:Lrp/AsnC family transcriptional regulator [Candidatus Phycosocius spiralis]|uniref:ArsR family transcriptional regulator n=1 Tax=Candidatus Phycosocius spiralis TaxID=2815099 RepID=A0ABQ4PU47_9PROT|nr:Lrp/AsnC family transcriptional regulator [Candidatus Phycosocius spiralis]GIU66514.1 ArsR family transcriptional regulator [Candidatus Phycosocius spiralis]